ncbi:MAG TPA: cation-efflux pump, partial [Actinomycetota bacterium]|nr:cation-efflux pump [Actinomycetota bacterium]
MRGEGWSGAQRVAGLALVVTVVLSAAKFVVWGITGSLAVLSQAVDSLVDIVALGLVFLGARITEKPADESHHYGHGKAENLVAFTQTLLLGGVVAFVVVESLRRLSTGEAPVAAPGVAIGLLVVSMVVDAVRARYLSTAARAKGSDALRAGALNLAADVGTAAVALASVLLEAAGVNNADPIGALIVCAGVSVAAFRLGKRSVDVLMDRAPGGPAEAIEAASREAPGVTDTRRVRVRPSGDRLFADVTVATGPTASLERAHEIAESVERAVERVVPGTDVVVHVEPDPASGVVEQVHAAASRPAGVQEIHNVSVSAVGGASPARLYVTLHAKTAPGVSLQEAHDLSDAIESSVIAELGEAARVDTHLEPLEDASPAADVTAARPDVVASVQRLAT